MRCIGKGLVIVSILLVIVLVVLAGAGAWLVRRPWPQTEGTITVAGLSAPVEILRDEDGVPHIYAQNEHDLLFAQGYVHAQDRLWQMEFNRRIGKGTLSAIVGEGTLDTDCFLRTVGLRRAAEHDWTLLDADTQALLEAYAQGVNAYMESHRDELPLEFTILGVDPEPWSPIDSLTWGEAMAFRLSEKYKFEILRARLVAELGEEAAQELMPPYPADAPLIIPPEAHSYAWLRGASSADSDALAPFLGPQGAVWGSNNWVVHGSRTETGQPLLANDMHLPLDMPSIWYENGLHGGRFDVVGYSFPGAPAVIVGHNAHIAWAVTNLPADVQDLYVEKLDDPTNPTQYEYEGQWHDLEIIPETIEVKGNDPVLLNVLITRHGPILNDVVSALEDAEPVALRWTSHDGNRIFGSVLGLNVATNLDEFRQALRQWDAPCQNFVFADTAGNIGYQTPCQIPIRAPGHQGLVPVPGWTGEYEWQGTIPFEELPSVLNPTPGYIVSANNRVVPDDYPHHLAYEWAAPYRAQRITDLLAADDSVSVEDIKAIHAQTYSLPAEELRPYLLAVEAKGDLQRQALEQVAAWDLYLETDRVGASIYEAWYWFLVHNTLDDELGEDLSEMYSDKHYVHVPMMIDMMKQPDSAWFDDVTTPQVETRDDIAARSLADAVAWLSENYGQDVAGWQWGRLHTMTFVHQPLGLSGIAPLEALFNGRTVPARGDNLTVDAATFKFIEPFAMRQGVSQRLIVDLSDLDKALSIHSTGQSGQLFHRHREDFIDRWQNVEYHPLVFSRAAVAARATETLTLTPP